MKRLSLVVLLLLAGCGTAPIRFQEALENWAYQVNHADDPIQPIQDTSTPTTRPFIPEKWP